MLFQDTDDEDKFIVEGIASWGAFYERGCAFTYDDDDDGDEDDDVDEDDDDDDDELCAECDDVTFSLRNRPDVFGRVAHYVDWIEENIFNNE